MKRVTLRVEDLDAGTTETYEATAGGQFVMPLVFRTVSAAVGAHSDEIATLTAAFKIIGDAIAACAVPAAEDVPG